MRNISTGKYRRLWQCSTGRGTFSILAMDHRNNLRKALNPNNPSSVSYQELVDFKLQATRELGSASRAVLLDPEYGAAQCINYHALPGSVGLLVAVEASGYGGEITARESGILEGWDVEKIQRMGASAVKLLVYYHPDASTSDGIEKLVEEVAGECLEYEIPLFLEILTYSINPQQKMNPDEFHRVVIEAANKLTIPGVDVIKVEFPLDTQKHLPEKEWAKACRELSSASAAPWILLSASADFETFLNQVRVACLNGASGVAVGRAVWQEATQLVGSARVEFLSKIARERMSRITDLCAALAKPWTDYYKPQQIVGGWYVGY